MAANLAALQVLRTLQDEARPPSGDEQRTLARWAGWGATPAVFDPANDEYAAERQQLQQQLTADQYQAAARTTLNAHYTDAAIAAAMWELLSDYGFGTTGGRVLEPGCGAGTFLGLAPPDAGDLVGVELDPTTAAIAAALYPHAQIRQESFAATRLPANSFDLTIGNVPFGKTALHDKVHNAAGHSMHNHFILKSLALTRPGGVVAVLTSHWTLDATNPAARREIAALADLVTAIRLPDNAHQRAAGTQVVTDLLVLRRRLPEETPQPTDGWELVERLGGDADRAVNVNRYFRAHPDRVIGELGTRSGQFGPELAVRYPADDVATTLRGRLVDTLRGYATTHGPLFSPPQDTPAPRILRADAPVGAVEGHLGADGDRFTVVRNGQIHDHPVPYSQTRELRALLQLRDVEVALLAAEAATTDDTEQIAELRRALNTRYDAYAAAFGPINRVKLRRTGRTDPDTGEERMARIRPPQGGFRDDPHAPSVYALEVYDAATGTATKSAIFTDRVVAPRPQRLGADTPEDAVAICLDTHGEVRLADAARLLGLTEDDARTALGALVFNDPADPGRLIPAAEYLSGNVRIKLTEARAAAERDGDDRWATNIHALTEVQPTDLTPAEITVRLGASWIDADVVAQFLRETLDDPTIKVENPGGSTWSVRGNQHSVLATSTHGTGRVSAVSLAQSLLEQRVIKVYDELDDGRRIPNLTETVAAQEKAAELNERFADWVWVDPDRAARLARLYNDTFNAIVLRSYDGAHRQFPGLAVTLQLRPHQVAAVVRVLAEPSVLLAHEVGAGKTLEMIVGCMELRRLGMTRKPAVVVPNHMLEQFSREWLQAYPQAKILAAGIDDLTRDRRRMFVARAATGDWDAVILSRSAFQRLGLTPDHQQAYYDQQLETLRTRLENSRSGGGLTVKRLEGALQRAEERLKKLTDTDRDPAISFEATGIDYLCIDEAHGYKNLQIASNIPGAGNDGSQRASDLDMKLHYLRERHGHRVATFATATPIANSVAEAYVMQRYLRPDVLDDAGLTDFDVWAATFGEVATDLELTPDGSGYKMKSRFSKFRNVPELLRMWHLSADIKTAEDLQLPTPAIAGGQPETIVTPASNQLTAFMADLAARADRVQAKAVDPREDNILKVASHGRLAALDLRLLPHQLYTALPAPDPGQRTKLEVAADRIADIHHQHATRTYSNHPTLGALQLVFCDLGTPDGKGWNAYTELRDLLAARGVPAESVRFMHEARNDREKGELFAAARTGRISVLIGSTEKMGVGTNVQARAVALHHLECPWRPADLAQRDGRAIRQGNLNDEVAIYRYVTESSFDGYTWQTVERKARFIAQVMRGRLDVREIEDVGDVALSYAEVKALACGDPRILEKARVDAEATRLERLHRSWTRTQRALEATLTGVDRRLPILQADLQRIEAAIPDIRPTRGDAFRMTVHGVAYTSRADAAIALRRALSAINPLRGDTDPAVVAHLGGFDVTACGRRFLDPHLLLELAGVPRAGIDVGLAELHADKPLGIITKLENRVAGLPAIRDEIAHEIARATSERDRAAADLGQPFPHTAALDTARQRAAELEAELAAEATPKAAATASSPPPGDHEAAEAPAAAPSDHAVTRPEAPGPPNVEPGTAEPQTSREWALRDKAMALDYGHGSESRVTRQDALDILDGRAGLFSSTDRDNARAHLDTLAQEKVRYHLGKLPVEQALDAGQRLLDEPDLPDDERHALAQYIEMIAPHSVSDTAVELAAGQTPTVQSATPVQSHASSPAPPDDSHQQPARGGPPLPAAWPSGDGPTSTSAAISDDTATPDVTAAPPAAARIRLVNTREGTLVTGTERGDTQARAALKAQGFKWSRRLEAWYLPRNYRYQTRSERVAGLRRALGDRLEIDHGDGAAPPPPSDQPPTPPQPHPDPAPAAEADTRPAAAGTTDLDADTPDRADPTSDEASELADLADGWQARFHPAGGDYGIWDMRDGRFLAIREGPRGGPQGAPVGPAWPTRTQVDTYVEALNTGHSLDEAQRAAVRADPTGIERGGRVVVVDHAPPGGWTDADRVTPVQQDTSGWPSVRDYPLGTWLTVHAVGADGPGRRLGHGTVVGHPGPEHVTVESPWGTRRTAGLSHVRPTQPTPAPHDQAPASVVPGRTTAEAPAAAWHELAHTIDPALTRDPAWPALASALQRAHDAGYPARERLHSLADRALPADNPAQALHYQLIADTDTAAAPTPPGMHDRPGTDRHPPPGPPPGTTPPSRPGPPR